MTPKEHIISSLEELKISKGKRPDNQSKIVDLIYGFLMSKKFRKYAVTPEYQKRMYSAILNSVSKNKPIKLTLVFGGYKLWRLEESPEVDWAELFSLIYYTKWLKPILAIYEPGVWFDFYSDDVILEIMNNVPKADTEEYAQSFKRLLEFIKPYVPTNLNFTYNRVGDQYDSYDNFKKELEQIIDKNNNTALTEEQISVINLNVKLYPGQAEAPNWREKVNEIHEAYCQVSKRRPYYRTPEKVLIITRPVKDSLAVGTTKRSVVKFWIGCGVLEKAGDSYVDYIFSPKQIEAGNFKEESIDIAGLEDKNFQTIKITEAN